VTDLGRLRFVPWLRPGLAAAAVAGTGGAADPRASVLVRLDVRRGDETATTPVPQTLRLMGPGDVVGLDPAQVIATVPKPATQDFEPNYLAAAVLDSPELPWLFSPDATPTVDNPAGRVRPWLCLVVVRREAAELVPAGTRPLPTLRLAEARGEVPNLAESWAWAHAQLTGTDAGVTAALAGPREHTQARLLCPRRLAPKTSYLACIVPAFAAGRQAGLGEPVTAGTEPAWGASVAGQLELPVYYSWEFACGGAGDFESLVRRLRPRVLGSSIGLRPLDVSHPGPGLPDVPAGNPGAALGLEGALCSPAMTPTDWPDPARRSYQTALEAQLQRLPGDAETIVTPPVYGSAQAGSEEIATAAHPPAWLRELNLDPRHRAAAAFGTRVVQDHQEQLMASAWDQAGDLHAANQLLREAQLARAVAGSIREKRLAHFAPETVLSVTEPAHARIQAPASVRGGRRESLLGSIRASVFPDEAVAPPFRRALRPQGPLGRRVGRERVTQLVQGLAAGQVAMPLVDRLDGGVEHDAVGAPKLSTVTADLPDPLVGWRKVADFGSAVGGAFVAPAAAAPAAAAAPVGVFVAAEPAVGTTALALRRRDDDLPPDFDEPLPLRRRRLGGINARFRAAARALQAYVGQPGAAQPPAAPALPIAAVVPELAGPSGRLDPEQTVPAAVLPRVQRPDAAGGGDRLAPVAFAPRFPQPMAEALRELSQDLLLPGADAVPADSVALLQGNARFIEAYIAGLNHELGRELQWRGLPADPRATFFQQFWDVRGRDAAAPGPASDVPALADWDPANGLGANATRVGGPDMLVLLVRGDVVRRYPTASIYAVEAATPTTLGTRELYPEFRGLLEPDMAFLGFGLSVVDALGQGGHPGWFFVIQEHATEPRFGLDEPDVPPAVGAVPARWRDLTWAHLVATAEELDRLQNVPVAGPALTGRVRDLNIEGATWGLNAAHMAQILLQLPARVAVHAKAILPPANAAPTQISAVERSRSRILAVGGVDALGQPWRLSEDAAIAAIDAGRRNFYVERPVGDRVQVVVARRGRRRYMKTTADGDRPNNLLELPRLP
jgi:hypothetical protein